MYLLPRLPATARSHSEAVSFAKLVRALVHRYPQRSRGSSTMVLLWGDATQANRLTHQDCDAFGLHLLHDLRAIALDRARAYGELGGNRLAGESFGYEIENLDLARSQPCKLHREMFERLMLGPFGEGARQPAIDGCHELCVIDWL